MHMYNTTETDIVYLLSEVYSEQITPKKVRTISVMHATTKHTYRPKLLYKAYLLTQTIVQSIPTDTNYYTKHTY